MISLWSGSRYDPYHPVLLLWAMSLPPAFPGKGLDEGRSSHSLERPELTGEAAAADFDVTQFSLFLVFFWPVNPTGPAGNSPLLLCTTQLLTLLLLEIPKIYLATFFWFGFMLWNRNLGWRGGKIRQKSQVPSVSLLSQGFSCLEGSSLLTWFQDFGL